MKYQFSHYNLRSLNQSTTRVKTNVPKMES